MIFLCLCLHADFSKTKWQYTYLALRHACHSCVCSMTCRFAGYWHVHGSVRVIPLMRQAGSPCLVTSSEWLMTRCGRLPTGPVLRPPCRHRVAIYPDGHLTIDFFTSFLSGDHTNSWAVKWGSFASVPKEELNSAANQLALLNFASWNWEFRPLYQEHCWNDKALDLYSRNNPFQNSNGLPPVLFENFFLRSLDAESLKFQLL